MKPGPSYEQLLEDYRTSCAWVHLSAYCFGDLRQYSAQGLRTVGFWILACLGFLGLGQLWLVGFGVPTSRRGRTMMKMVGNSYGDLKTEGYG